MYLTKQNLYIYHNWFNLVLPEIEEFYENIIAQNFKSLYLPLKYLFPSPREIKKRNFKIKHFIEKMW